jgi:hypothetical protein
VPRTLQQLFVNRDQQIQRFLLALDGTRTTRRIVTIAAGPGMGKSWLLREFASQCAERSVPHALVDFGDGQAYDALLLARTLRDQLAAPEFNRLTETINEITNPRLQVSAAPSGPSTGISITGSPDARVDVSGTVAGRDVITIKDNYLVFHTDDALVRQVLDDRISVAFGEALRLLAARTRVAFLFDTYERTATGLSPWVPGVADRWITRALLEPIRDGKLQNVVVVLAGTALPAFDAEWAAVVGALGMPGFAREDVAEYLRVNRGLAELSEDQITALYTAVQGNPTLLGVIGDNLENAANKGSDDEW